MNDEHAADTVDPMVSDLPLVAAAALESDHAPEAAESLPPEAVATTPPLPTTVSVTPGGTLVVPIASRRGRRWALAALVAALVVMTLPFLRKRPPAPIDPMSGAGTAPVTLIDPAADAALTPDVRFAWHRLRGALSYEMVLFDRKGQPLQRQATADTVLTAANVPAETAAWSITTRMADGTLRTSEVRKLGPSR